MPIRAVVGALVVVLMVSCTAGVAWGSVSIAAGDVWGIVWAHLSGTGGPSGWTPGEDQVVWQLRLPRVLLAAMVGATLTSVGTVIQALVRNPLADPFILGVSSGASVGAASVLLFGAFAGFGVWALSAGGFLGALAAVVIVFSIAQQRGQLSPVRLVLVGVALAFLFEATTSFLVFRSDPRASQTVLFWLLGSFGRASWPLLGIPATTLAVGVGYLLLQARRLNALALGDDTAVALGVDVRRLRASLFLVTSVMTGVAVAVSGAIGFIGLVLPHVVRLLVGADHRRVLPVGVLLGAVFMIWGDLAARTLVAPQELPVGVVTAFAGAPLLIALIRRGVYRVGVSS